MRELLIDVHDFETRIAVVEAHAAAQPAGMQVANRELVELHVERAGASSLVGNLYWGEVVRVVPGIQAAFVDIGLARPGFLHVRDMPAGRTSADGGSVDIARLLRERQRLLVQVAKDPLNGKGARLSTNIALAARYVVLLPRGGGIAVSQRLGDPIERERLKEALGAIRAELGQERRGCIVRTAAEGASASQLRTDLDTLLGRWQHVQGRCRAAPAAATLILAELPLALRMVRDLVEPTVAAIVVNHDATFERLNRYVSACLPALRGRVRRYNGTAPLFAAAGVENAIGQALDRRVPLVTGGHLVIEHTEAMTTIDVNSGTRLASANLQTTALQTNLQAARVIPKQLRLRNIGGIVVVDFIDMEDPAHRDQVMATLLDAAGDDPARFRASGFSTLGLVEISRRRVRETLHRQLCDPCVPCGGSGYARSPQTVCYDILRALQWRTRIDDASEHVVHAAPCVARRLLDEEGAHLAKVRQGAGRAIRVQADAELRVDEFRLDSR